MTRWLRRRGSLGASTVEYALILGFVVGGVALALDGVDDGANGAITERGDRIGNPEGLAYTGPLPSTSTVPPSSTTPATTTTPAPAPTTTTSTTTTTIVLPTTTTSTTVPGPTSTTTTTTIVSSIPHVSVGSLAGSAAKTGGDWTATVLVTVVDHHGDPISGVLVSGAWSEDAAHVAECVTGVDGTCTVSQTDLKRTGSGAVASTTYYVQALSADGVIPIGPVAADHVEVLNPAG